MDKEHFIRYAGDTFKLGVTLTDADNEPVDLEDAEVCFSLVIDPDEPITENTEGVTINVTDNRIDIIVGYELMEVDPSVYPFDVEVTFAPDGETGESERRTLFVAELELREDVTRHDSGT